MILYSLLENKEVSSNSNWIKNLTNFHDADSDINYTININTFHTAEQKPFCYFNVGDSYTINTNIFTPNADRTPNVNHTFMSVEEINLC